MIKKFIRLFREDTLRIAIPARVVNTDSYEKDQTVTVKPVIDYIYPNYNNAILKSNTIPNVFVKLPEGGGFKIKLPVKQGDLCTLHWSHKDLDEFLNGTGDDVTQSKKLVGEMGDCWVELGFGTRKVNQSPSQTDLIIEGDSTTITITPSGEVSVVTSGTSTVKSSGHTIDAPTTNITGTLTVEGDTTVNANITATGTSSAQTVAASTSLTVAGTEMAEHAHGGVSRGSSNTDPV